MTESSSNPLAPLANLPPPVFYFVGLAVALHIVAFGVWVLLVAREPSQVPPPKRRD